MSADARPIAVFGATGFTGRLVAAALHARNQPLLLAGRDPGRLQALAAELPGSELLVVRLEDRAALDALARRAAVLINCVGPFVDYGEPVVRAAIANGAHYVDTTGEQSFVRSVQVHDTWARTERVAVVPALAFEIALADCAAALLAERLDEIERVHVTYATQLHPSRGTARTAVRMLQEPGLSLVDGVWVEEPAGRVLAHVDLPPRRLTALSFPGAEVITIARHIGPRTVRTFLQVPALPARLLSTCAPALPSVARVAAPLARLWLGTATDGPDPGTRRRDQFAIAVDGRGRHGSHAAGRRVVVRGRDPYGVTAAVAARGAEWLRDGHARALGVLSPATAFDPRALLDALDEDGVTYEESAL